MTYDNIVLWFVEKSKPKANGEVDVNKSNIWGVTVKDVQSQAFI